MKTIKFMKTPMCETCGREPATSFGFFEDILSDICGRDNKPEWTFIGDCSYGITRYHIQFDRFFDSPRSTVGWLAYLHEKGLDASGFMDMMIRFRKATDSFIAI